MVAGVTLRGLLVVAVVAAGGALGVGLARVAWRQRGVVPGARACGATLAAAGGWGLAYAGLLASPPSLAVAVLDPLVVGLATVTPFAWFLFAVAYTGTDGWVTRRRLALLFAEPALFVSLYLSNPLHGRLVDGHDVVAWEGLTLVSPGFTAWLWLQVAVAYAVTLVGAGLVLAFVTRARNGHRRQATAVLLAALVTTAGTVLSLAGLGPHPALDVTPVFLLASYVVVAWAVVRDDFLSVAPVARDDLVTAMGDPVVVLDGDDHLLEYNRAAARTLGVDDADVGGHVDGALHGLTAALDAGDAVALRTVDGERATYDPRPTSLTDREDVRRRRLVVLREVTQLKRREQTLAALQSATRELMTAEREATVAAVVAATAADVLDREFAAFLAYDPERERLASTALSPTAAAALEGDELVFGPADEFVWERFQAGEVVVEDGPEPSEVTLSGDLALSSAVLLPVGDHGLLAVGSPSGCDDADDAVRFLEVLASAAEAALDRLAREGELREQRDALAERNERLQNFASIVSHDLRTPLTTATGYLALARQDLGDPEGHLERVADSHERMDSLVDGLLALARNGQVVDDPEPVPIEEVALNAWQTAGHVDATFDVEPFPGRVLADRERVRTLLENLLGNAVEHVGTDVSVAVGPIGTASTGSGGAASDVAGVVADPTPDAAAGDTTAAGAAEVDHADGTPVDAPGAGSEDDAAAGFYVEDDGPGIPPEEREAVLEEGYSGDTGTGLGLAIVDRIADAHGWAVIVTDGVDGGARFEFTDVEPAE